MVKKIVFVKAFVLILVIQGYVYGASPALETWDDGLLNDWVGNTTYSTVEARSVGGNPDGWLFSSGPGTMAIGALTRKTVFTGDYQATPIQRVSVDLSFISDNFTAAWLRFRYEDSTHNGWHYPLATSFPTDGWHEYIVEFDPNWSDIEAFAEGWVKESSSPTFAETMGEVYTAEIRLLGQEAMEAGIDNFQIAESEPDVVEVDVDIKPGSCPNPLRVNFIGNGVFPVAIVGSEDFDVLDIDPDTVTLIGVPALRGKVSDVSTAGDLCELGSDGISDLVLKFDRQAVLAALEDIYGTLGDLPNRKELFLTLLAETYEGEPVTGTDSLVVLNRGGIKRKK